MNTLETYSRHCARCNEETPHAAVRTLPMRTAIRIGKIIVFFLTFAVAFPHILASGGDEFAVTCTKCNSQATISQG